MRVSASLFCRGAAVWSARTIPIKDTADLLASLLTLSRFVWLNLAEAPEKEPPSTHPPTPPFHSVIDSRMGSRVWGERATKPRMWQVICHTRAPLSQPLVCSLSLQGSKLI